MEIKIVISIRGGAILMDMDIGGVRCGNRICLDTAKLDEQWQQGQELNPLSVSSMPLTQLRSNSAGNLTTPMTCSRREQAQASGPKP